MGAPIGWSGRLRAWRAASAWMCWTAAVFAAAGAAAPTNSSLPEGPRRKWSISLRWENDTFGGTDRFYTDGIALAVTHTGPTWMDPVADWLPWGEGRRTVGYDAEQIMVTPSDTTLSVPDPNDRPYAGILAVGLALHVEKDHSYNGLKFITGVVGPWALAAETQRQVHRWLGQDYPKGWDHQLHNEPIFNLVYEHRRKYRLVGRADGWAVEALPMGNLMLGNVLTQGQLGTQLRLGYRIPDDFGVTLMRGMVHLPPPRVAPRPRGWRDWGVFAYGGVNANFVLRNITLDGNTWKDSPSVDKEWFVPAGEVGIGISSRHFVATFSYVFWGKEFKNQVDYTEFGALSFTWIF